MSKIEKHIDHIQLQLKLNALIKSMFIGLGSGLLFDAFQDSLAVTFSISIISFAIGAYFQGLFKDQKSHALQILHERLPALEFSLELLDKKEKNLAETLQWERINHQVPEQYPSIYQEGLKVFMVFFLICAGVFALSFVDWNSTINQEKVQPEIRNTLATEEATPLVALSELHVTIRPPAYTGLPVQEQNTLEIKTIKGSEIKWSAAFSNSDQLNVTMVNSQGEELIFTKENQIYSLKDEALGSGIYALRGYQGEEKVFESSFFTMEVFEDKVPLIQPSEKEVYKFHFQKDPQVMNLEARVSDDFRVKEVYLVATLARGSGENVKFRESRIDLEERDFKSATVSVQLDFDALEFQQGDELYYYWAAKDNKLPESNYSRSDTYFIKYVDSSGLGETEMAGMAINVLPEYFRSQRQIIIDTEKLIAERSTMKEQTFNETSNNIGYDQKLLRLRYGQYLGEEFENSAGGGSMVEDDGDILAGYRHAHDEEGEHEMAVNLGASETVVEESHSEEEHASEDESGLGDLLSAYMHNHEEEETNTFFEESTKSALKMALEQMWESELYLRLYEPEKALPFEKKALEYLKSVQQKSRVYVKRTGFDPPPIKEEEKRLTGELDDLDQQIRKEQVILQEKIGPLASQVIGLMSKNELNGDDQLIITEFGKLWTAKMQYSGMEEWSVLLELQQLSSGEISREGKIQLFESIYPFAVSGERKSTSYLQQQDLERAFWKNIK